MLTELRKKRIQRVALGLNATEFDDESGLLLFEDNMVYYKLFATSLGVLRASRCELDPNDWYMSKASSTFLYKEICVANGIEFAMRRCPKGSFDMSGYNRLDDKNLNNFGHNPLKKTPIELPFFLGETEVTKQLYFAVTRLNPNKSQTFQKLDYELPVSCSWIEAVRFCNALNDLYGLDHCYTACKNVILFRDLANTKPINNFYQEIIEVLKALGIENVYLDVDVDDETLINNPFYLVHGGIHSVHSRFIAVRDRLKLRPGYNFSEWQKKSPYRMIDDLKWGINYFFKAVQDNPSFDPTKNGYRLPSEKEWEYAAKASTQNRWAGTDNENDLENYAWFWDNSNLKDEQGRHRGFTIKDVKTKRPNAWGFYDMSGNAAELCNEIFSYSNEDYGVSGGKYYYSQYGCFIHYVCRGGDFMTTNSSLNVSSRRPSSGSSNVYGGFRIARTDFK